MDLEATAKATEDDDVEETPEPQEKNDSVEMEENPNCAKENTNPEDIDKPQPPTDTAKTEPKVHISAHERDREEQASRRVQEAQKYHTRDKAGRGGFRGGRGSYKNNSRFDPSKQEKSDDPVAIRKQVEFYFSESNLLTDKFLFERVEGHKNVPVPVEVIHSFKRMQHFQPREAVVEALKESTVLNVVDDDTAVQRKVPLPEGLTGKSMDEVQKVHEDRSMAKSVYVKGFGEEESTTQFDIEAWFANFGLTNSVRLRRDPNKGFKGSVFVEFDTEETQHKFLSLEPLPKWKGKELEIKSKKQYCDAKVEDINKGRIRKNSPNLRYEDRREKRARRGSPTYDNKRHDYVEGEDTRDWRQRRNEEASNGYRENKHKGYGSSGRRDRGGYRGGKGGRDRHDEKERDSEKHDPMYARDTASEPSTNDDTTTKDQLEKVQTTKEIMETSKDSTVSEDTPSKKRVREDSSSDEGQGNEKKVDVKGGSE